MPEAPGQRELESLALAGVLAVTLALGLVAVSLDRERYEQTQYLLLGALTPLGVLWLGRGAAPRWARRSLAIVGASAIIAYVAFSGRWVAWLLAGAQVLLTAIVARRRPRAIELLTSAGAWAAVWSLSRNIINTSSDTLGSYVLRADAMSRATTLFAFVFVVTSLAVCERKARPRVRWWGVAAITAGYGILALESFRVDYLFDRIAIFHWGTFVSPVEAIRQGGWLLWDTPATYGPGATLAVALTPAASPWDAYFYWNVLFCFVSAALVFSLLRDQVPAPAALLLALCAVFWLPGIQHSAVLYTPNAGPFRFVWCQLLLVLVARKPERPAALVVGSVLWLVACMWSSDRAAFCSGVWLPGLTLLVWKKGRWSRLGHLAVPALLAAVAVGAVQLFYVYRLGHGPDWYAYTEASLGVSGGVAALPIRPWGPVAVLMLVFWIVASAALRATAEANDPRDLAPPWAAMSLLWALGVYFVARSHGIAVLNLLPTQLLIALVALRVPNIDSGIRAACATVLTAVLLLGLHERSGWWPRSPLSTRWALGVTQRLPTLDPQALALVRKAGIVPGDAIVYAGMTVMPAWPREAGPVPPNRLWLPIEPLEELVTLSPERRSLYVERFVARTRSSGWLIESPLASSALAREQEAWLWEALARSHRATRNEAVGQWRATYYEYVGG